MSWESEILDRLTEQPLVGYSARQRPATEPTALAALSLLGNDRPQAAARAIDWLCGVQADDGSVGVAADAASPCWPTALAVLAWRSAADNGVAAGRSGEALQKGVEWILRSRGEPIKEQGLPIFGHNTQLVAWPWVAGTHSWMEPTCLFVLALKACGRSEHPRTREAVRLIHDRLLPDGGCNYGNTVVLGSRLRAHVQPSGMAAAALWGESDGDGRLGRTLDRLEREIPACRGTTSLAWAALGIAAHRAVGEATSRRLGESATALLADSRDPYRMALLSLARLGPSAPCFPSPIRIQIQSNREGGGR